MPVSHPTRFPRTYRDAFGGEQMMPLPKRVTFLRGHRHIHRGDVLIVIAAVVTAVALIAGWLK